MSNSGNKLRASIPAWYTMAIGGLVLGAVGTVDIVSYSGEYGYVWLAIAGLCALGLHITEPQRHE